MLEDRREQLRTVLKPGLSKEPLGHAEQVARIAGILHEAFRDAGLRSTVVGGSAIELHAPGIYVSGDIDLVVEAWGQQAIDLLAAFAGDLDEEWLRAKLEKEGSLDALEPLRRLAESNERVTREVLEALLRNLSRGSGR